MYFYSHPTANVQKLERKISAALEASQRSEARVEIHLGLHRGGISSRVLPGRLPPAVRATLEAILGRFET